MAVLLVVDFRMTPEPSRTAPFARPGCSGVRHAAYALGGFSGWSLPAGALRELAEIRGELAHRPVEERDVPVRSRLHDAAFHDGEHELRELAAVRVGRQSIAGGDETFLDRGRPRGEIDGERFPDDGIG